MRATSAGVYLLWQLCFQVAVVTTWQTQISRVLSARDEATAKRMYRRTAFYFVGRFALPGLWGAAAMVYFSQHGGLPAALQGLPANEASLRATPAYLGLLLPTGFIGLLLAAALAAEMSTDSGYLLTWATVIYNDLIAPCVKKPLSPAARLFITRALVLAIGLFLLFYGLWYELPGNAWDYLAVTGNIYLASVCTLLVAGLYWRRATTQGAYAALVLGAIGPITFLVVNMLIVKARQLDAHLPATPLAGAGMAADFNQRFRMPSRSLRNWRGPSSFVLAFLGMIVGSLLSRSPEAGKAPDTTGGGRMNDLFLLFWSVMIFASIAWYGFLVVLCRLQRRAGNLDHDPDLRPAGRRAAEPAICRRTGGLNGRIPQSQGATCAWCGRLLPPHPSPLPQGEGGYSAVSCRNCEHRSFRGVPAAVPSPQGRE